MLLSCIACGGVIELSLLAWLTGTGCLAGVGCWVKKLFNRHKAKCDCACHSEKKG